jgi:alpha-ketoglutarate-dependent taurine dioxygenase
MESSAVLDLVLTDDPAPMLEHEVGPARAWRSGSIGPQQWQLTIDAAAAKEIDALVEAIRAEPRPLLLCHPRQFELAACERLMAQVRHTLTDGVGLAVLDRLGLDQISRDEATVVYWVLGNLLGRPVATKWDGTMLYDVRDTGKQFGRGVRGSATNVELRFHTDNAFGRTLPDFVGLLCLQQAQAGGVSRFCSLYTVHNELLRRDPRLLRRLYAPAFYDRQNEHAPDAPKVLRAPMFSYDGDRLSARLVPGLIRSGYELVGAAPDAELVDALALLETVLTDESIQVEFTIAPGQLQYLNNLECAHYRSRFVDADEPTGKRHLIRVWHRDFGDPTYDGCRDR